MYAVSNEYLEAMKSPVQHHRISGTIGTEPFDEENILQGSLQILLQCSGNQEIQIGQVMVGELSATFYGVDIPKGSWQGKEITVVFSMLVGEVWEPVPVGKFTIVEANWSVSGITVKAYDNMAKLDKKCSQRFTNTAPYAMLTAACNECGLTLGNTRAEVEAMPNGTESMTEYEDNDVETWRDFISWLSQTLGGFAYAGRDGKIYIKQYNNTVVDTIDDEHRHRGATFSDFATKYTGMQVVNIKYATTTYYHLPVDDGLTYSIGQNPFLQNLENGTQRRSNILDALAVINFTPFTLSMIGNIAYDLGDVLHFYKGVVGDDGVDCCITKILYKHKQGVTLQGVGKNPATASGKSKTDKNIAGLMNKTANNEFRFDSVTGGDVSISDGGNGVIIHTDLNTNENSQLFMTMEALVDVTQTASGTPAVGTVSYIFDGDTKARHPIETWTTGNHILSLQNFFDVTTAGAHWLDVQISMVGGTLSIDELGIIQTWSGTGIVASNEFDGRVYVSDSIGEIDIPETTVDMTNVADDGEIEIINVSDLSFTDTIGNLAMPETTVDMQNVDDFVMINDSERITEEGEIRITEDGAMRITS